MKRPRPGPPPDLLLFDGGQRVINRGSTLWTFVHDWEHAGLVRVRWNTTGEIAWVRLTAAGRGEVERHKQRRAERAGAGATPARRAEIEKKR